MIKAAVVTIAGQWQLHHTVAVVERLFKKTLQINGYASKSNITLTTVL